MKIMGHQFVMGRTLAEALARGRKGDNARYRYSFDMLGEAALTRDDADRYLRAYHDAIAAIGRNDPFENEISAPAISVKPSALHPRYAHAKRERTMAALAPRLTDLPQPPTRHATGPPTHTETTNPPDNN